MNANDRRQFVVRKRTAEEIAAEKKAARPPFIELLAAQWPGFLGLILIVGSFVLFFMFHDTYAWYVTDRLSMVIGGAGIASLGYWGFANHSRDYHF